MKRKVCLRCGHVWTARVPHPVQCSRCKSPTWNVKRKGDANVQNNNRR